MARCEASVTACDEELCHTLHPASAGSSTFSGARVSLNVGC